MTTKPKIVRSNKILWSTLHQLEKNDIICGRIATRPGEEAILTNLVERGIHLIPSGTSQLASRSKVFQTKLFSDFMVEGTIAVCNRQDLLSAYRHLSKTCRGPVLLKEDRKDGGLGVHLFACCTELYNHAMSQPVTYPFVLQPHLENAADIRAIFLGEHIEAYERRNSSHWKKNICSGAHAKSHPLSESELFFCKQVMERGRFPYAHIDYLRDGMGRCWLLEINLRGGLKGASLAGNDYLAMTKTIHENLLDHYLKQKSE